MVSYNSINRNIPNVSTSIFLKIGLHNPEFTNWKRSRKSGEDTNLRTFLSTPQFKDKYQKWKRAQYSQAFTSLHNLPVRTTEQEDAYIYVRRKLDYG